MPAHPSASRHVERALLAPQPATDYLWIPQKLLDTLYDSPLAIGLYALITRRWLADGDDQAGIILSDRDLLAFDPSLSRSAIMRALKRLIDGGWLQVRRARGRKTAYIPSWGSTKTGTLRLWKRTKGCGLGRGATPTIRISRALLDDYMGRIIPHERRPAVIERFSTEAQLSVRDIGTHALLQRQRVSDSTAQLEATGLSRDGLALTVPATPEILATTELSIQGMQRLGMVAPGPIVAQRAAADPRPPVFLVAPKWPGQWSGRWPGQQVTDQRRFSAPEGHETALVSADAKQTGMLGMLGISFNPLQVPCNHGGGLGVMSTKNGPDSNQKEVTSTKARTEKGGVVKKETKSTIIPDTPTALLLRSINVRPGQISELADVPLAWAEAALADANARDGIKSIPSWVVSLLRDARDQGYTIGGDPASAETVMSDERVTELATAFRHETPTASRPTTIPPALWDSLPAWLHELLDGATVTPERVTARTPWQQDQLASRGALLVRALLTALLARDPVWAFERALRGAAPPRAEQPAPPAPASVPPGPGSLAAIWAAVAQELATQLIPADYQADIAPLQLAALRPGQAELVAPTPAIRDRVSERWTTLLQSALAGQLGDICPKLIVRLGPTAPSVPQPPSRPLATVQLQPTPAPAPTPAAEAAVLPPPPWVRCPDQWARLPRLVQATLAGATEQDGQIVGANSFLTKQIQTRYGRVVTALRGEEVGGDS